MNLIVVATPINRVCHDTQMSLRNQDFLSDLDLTHDQIKDVLKHAKRLKKQRAQDAEELTLANKTIALLFEKPSTRTRAAFEVAAAHQGAHATFLAPGSIQLGEKESVADTAQVLGRIYDAIVYRGGNHQVIETLADNSPVPVINALTDQWHPTQALADLLTMQEHADKPLDEMVCAFVGDTHSNVAQSLLISASRMGVDVRLVGPQELWPDASVIGAAEISASEHGGKVTITADTRTGVKDADFIYTDVWVSMGESSDVWSERVDLLRDYQVNATLMALTDNSGAKFLHCLPAFHDTATQVGREIAERTGMDSLEVSDEVFQSGASVVFDQAENRLHTIKALLIEILR
jgi:ornithine carbamoyltransferase